VQGVGFRWFVLLSARRLGVRGTVRNLRDGRVEFVAQGDGRDVERLIGSVREGPAGSCVEDVELDESTPAERYDEFTIR
jgi:acylphosphatase